MSNTGPTGDGVETTENQDWFVYMLQCADGSLYTGATVDLERRINQHNRGVGARYTRSRLPVSLCYWEKQDDRSSALRREIALKRCSRPEKLRLIERAKQADGLSANASTAEHY